MAGAAQRRGAWACQVERLAVVPQGPCPVQCPSHAAPASQSACPLPSALVAKAAASAAVRVRRHTGSSAAGEGAARTAAGTEKEVARTAAGEEAGRTVEEGAGRTARIAAEAGVVRNNPAVAEEELFEQAQVQP